MRPFLETTPLAAYRSDMDSPEDIEEEKATGGRPAYDHEIAGLVGLLCMPEAAYTTGSVLCANGGMVFTS
jgi:NAD(P)-dependent dehydrogenase (short-subunit alcohol dehydrogenase family)